MSDDTEGAPTLSGAPDPKSPPEAAKDPIVAAAQQMILEVFKMSAARLPDLLQAQSPTGSQMPKLTATMLNQLSAQIERALGLPPSSDGSGPL